MAFPYADRDYSMYSTSTNEGSVGRARNDLDRCAHILNEVIDNGAGILDGVKKRKSNSSPAKEIALFQNKKLRQTNRVIEARNAGKITSSTPQQTPLSKGRGRQRSSSASSTCSIYSLRPLSQSRRIRSLSVEQRCSSSLGRSSRRDRSVSRHSSKVPPDSTHSVQANLSSVSSEADTLTGVHLDNSSQFGIPPVFNAKGERISRSSKTTHRSRRRSRSASRAGSLGWLKPQASISTQTIEAEAAARQSAGQKGRVSKRGRRSQKENIPVSSKSEPAQTTRFPLTTSGEPIRIPSVTKENLPSSKADVKRSAPGTRISKSLQKVQRENDVDDLLERTLTENLPHGGQVLPQLEVEENSNSSETSHIDRERRVRELLDSLKTAALLSDKVLLSREFEVISETMMKIVRDSLEARTSVDQLLIPFQRESRELKEHVRYLQDQLTRIQQDQGEDMTSQHRGTRGQGDGDTARDLSMKFAAEARVSQLSHQLQAERQSLAEERSQVHRLSSDITYYIEQVEDLKRENRQLHLDLSMRRTENVEPFDGATQGRPGVESQRLKSLQQSVREFHTRLTQISSVCEASTASQINTVLELCAHKLVQSMEESITQRHPQVYNQVNVNNNSRWEDKPYNLAEVVSSNLTKTRRTGEALAKPNPRLQAARPSESIHSVTQYFQKYHPEAAVTSMKGPSSSPRHGSPHKESPGRKLLSHPSNQSPSKSTVRKLWDIETPYNSTQRSDKQLATPAVTYQHPVFTSSDVQSPSTITAGTSDIFMPGGKSAIGHWRSDKLPAGASALPQPAGALDRHEQLHSTLRSNDSDSTLDADVTSDSSTLSMATTLADNKFQEGLAQLDANIAKLQRSLRDSQLSTTM